MGNADRRIAIAPKTFLIIHYELPLSASERYSKISRFVPRLRAKTLSPRRASKQSRLPLSPRQTQVRLKPLLLKSLASPEMIQTHGRPPAKSTVCGLNGLRPLSASSGCPPFKSSTRLGELAALALAASFLGALCFASLSAEKYVTTYFSVRKRTPK
jgi:hypothetical protein